MRVSMRNSRTPTRTWRKIADSAREEENQEEKEEEKRP